MTDFWGNRKECGGLSWHTLIAGERSIIQDKSYFISLLGVTKSQSYSHIEKPSLHFLTRDKNPYIELWPLALDISSFKYMFICKLFIKLRGALPSEWQSFILHFPLLWHFCQYLCPTTFSCLKDEECFWDDIDKHGLYTGPAEWRFNYLHQAFVTSPASFRSSHAPSPSLVGGVIPARPVFPSSLQFILIHRHLKQFPLCRSWFGIRNQYFEDVFLHGLLSFQNQNILRLLKAHRNIPCMSWQETVIKLSSNCSDCGKVRMLDYTCQHVQITAARGTAGWRLDRRREVYRCKLQPIVDSRATSAFLRLH